jgi:hypothetical protein
MTLNFLLPPTTTLAGALFPHHHGAVTGTYLLLSWIYIPQALHGPLSGNLLSVAFVLLNSL